MGFLFSKPKKKEETKVNEKDKAVLQLKRQRDRLKKYQKQLADVIEREKAAAKQLLREGKKEKALLVLKKKKYQESLIAKTEGQLFNVEEMVESIKFAELQNQVFESLKVGNEVLTAINKETDIEDVQRLMEDSAEAIAYQEEISRMLGSELSVEDNEALEAEMAALEEAEQQSEAQDQKVPELPEVPTSPIAVPEPAVTVETTKKEVVIS